MFYLARHESEKVYTAKAVFQQYYNNKANKHIPRSRARTNGATATFRRPSTVSTSQRESGQSSTNHPPSAGSAYVPPHMNPNYQSTFGRNGASSETRYSKDQLLDMFRTHQQNGKPGTRINDLFMDGWTPSATNGTENGGWGKKDGHNEAAGTDICWDYDGSIQPIGLIPMDDEEREVCESKTLHQALWTVTDHSYRSTRAPSTLR